MLAGVAVAIIALGASAVALAAGHKPTHHPKRAPRAITACIPSHHGRPAAMRYTTRRSCPKGERAIRWNATGTRGRTGAVGATGPAGAAGPAGPAGLATGISAANATELRLGVTTASSYVAITPAATTAGTYFVSGQVAMQIGAGDTAECELGVGPYGGAASLAGEVSVASAAQKSFTTLPLTARVQVAAGQVLALYCFGRTGSADTIYADGGLTATLMNADADSTQAPARPSPSAAALPGRRVAPAIQLPRLPRRS